MSSLLKSGLTFQSPLLSFPVSCGFYVDCTQNSGFMVSRPAMCSFDVMIKDLKMSHFSRIIMACVQFLFHLCTALIPSDIPIPVVYVMIYFHLLSYSAAG